MRRNNRPLGVGRLDALGISERYNYGGPMGRRRRLAMAGAWFVTLGSMIWFEGTGPEQITISKAAAVLVAASLIGCAFGCAFFLVYERLLGGAMAPTATDRLEALSILRRGLFLANAAAAFSLFVSVWILADGQPGDLRGAAYFAALLANWAVAYILGFPGIAGLTVTWLEEQDTIRSANSTAAEG